MPLVFSLVPACHLIPLVPVPVNGCLKKQIHVLTAHILPVCMFAVRIFSKCVFSGGLYKNILWQSATLLLEWQPLGLCCDVSALCCWVRIAVQHWEHACPSPSLLNVSTAELKCGSEENMSKLKVSGVYSSVIPCLYFRQFDCILGMWAGVQYQTTLELLAKPQAWESFSVFPVSPYWEYWFVL